MLTRANRIIAGSDYRRVSRRGRRTAGKFAVVSVVSPSTAGVPRFGFIITRKIGGAVVRNRVRRRMKAIARSLVDQGMPARDVVVRALPAAVSADWASLHHEIEAAAMGSMK
ncbi:ribonuclease P protein component [Amnibacterium flavum]|uniref:Ribonuclease P protein component n=1 Tax=Amnibacterium flavum TaxID=2173173 RepID=A0A2V1HUV0_9MICO|nr:ribonuclease P protein component [Amnibacterium flavum]PVZ95482.1 ribonuclease P protein component [Amnibacterium flavum]